jgi:hypothetical protein
MTYVVEQHAAKPVAAGRATHVTVYEVPEKRVG